ncbi:hypothetical protein Hanom_Chr05g00414481 [Helianthus anomalus]
MLADMLNPKRIPQFPGSVLASAGFGFRLLEADLRQLQAASLSSMAFYSSHNSNHI